ncbi:MAG: hypothetical protein H6Q63_310 [Firmicutes bacterium]|nr:hypothetical protein [Bacillota bacterium]
MFVDYSSLNTYRIRHIREVITMLVCILMFCFGVHALSVMEQSKNTIQIDKPSVPLLLNSGIVQAEKAEFNIIIWFEDKEIPLAIRTMKPTPDWIWTYKELNNENKKGAVTLSGQCSLNKNEERNLFAWYTTMGPQIEMAGGKVYLDERIPETIDISAYLSQTNAVPIQCVLLDNMISTAAYQSDIESSVMAGQDRINIQLLSRGKKTEGQSVLAIPVLLQQF